jgi:type II secretory pathway pseudopilin PulG
MKSTLKDNKNIKIKGFTLIEVLLVVMLAMGFMLIFFNMDMNVDKEQNSRKVGTQLNMLATAIDKRLAVEGKLFSDWKNGTEWVGEANFQKFLKQELVGKNNTTCGDPTYGWNPTLNLNGLDPTSDEGKTVVYLHNNALNGKLVPCTLWQVTPYNVQPTVKLFETTDDKLKNVLFSFKFKDADAWKKGFADFNKSYNFAKEQKNTTLLTQKEFYYTNQSGAKINLKNCLNLKENCSLNMNVIVGSSSTDDKKFKVDSSNSFETNLGFAKSVKYNEQINCNIWTLDTSVYPSVWKSRETACGVTGGTDGDKEIALIGDNIDAKNVKITGRCYDYKDLNTAATSPLSECGLIDNNTYVELNNNNIQAENIASKELKVKNSYNHEINVKNGMTVTNVADIVGLSLSEQTSGSNYTSKYENCVIGVVTASCPENFPLLKATETASLTSPYRITPAGTAFEGKNITVPKVTVDYDSNINSKTTAERGIVTNKLESNNTTTAQQMFVAKEASLTASNFTQTNVTTNIINTDKAAMNSITSNNKVIISGNITANDVNVSNSFETEQLNFRTAFNSDKLLKFSKSVSFDNLGNKYIITNNAISGWGAEGYKSNSGIYAHKFYLNGNIVVNSTDAASGATVANTDNGMLSNYVGYRKGMTLIHLFPDTRGMFYMNDVGKLMVSAYYDLGATRSGLRIGGSTGGRGFFWGLTNSELGTAFGDQPIYTNLDSSIYGYTAGQNIKSLVGGYKTIMNNLTVYNNRPANLYAGAYYHAGLPRKMDSAGNLSSEETPVNYIENGIGVYWETADGIYLRHLVTSVKYYLDRISYIYGNYVVLNKSGTIKGSKGLRGARGDTGIAGIRGETGSDGIPGPVGLRGGE